MPFHKYSSTYYVLGIALDGRNAVLMKLIRVPVLVGYSVELSYKICVLFSIVSFWSLRI